MKPPYEITNSILRLIASISEKIGEVNAAHLHKPSPELRKRNRVKTIKASLEIEGNTLSEDQITAIIENKRVIGPKKDILEVMNAIEVYERLPEFNPNSLKSFLKAHKLLMSGLIEDAGKLRTKPVGIFKGAEVAHIAPPAANLDYLMKELFHYMANEDDPVLIKSCVVHYEIEFIHPFMDGNGRMGRLWQTLVLLKTHSIFEYLPFETIIKARQQEYYDVLAASDNEGKSTKFIEFILEAIDESLGELLMLQNRSLTEEGRIDYFLATYQGQFFTRKDYLNTFKDISSSTASRDIKYAVEKGLITKQGDKRTAKYKIEGKKNGD
ncbi:MAG: Fic family protein [Saprospirales bacterium]|nr:Fic family protein [Saprospirales bacterium]